MRFAGLNWRHGLFRLWIVGVTLFVIAAASIVAKVTRDRTMLELHGRDPRYGFDRHKGYATREHLDAVSRFGYSDAHRRSFRPPTLFDRI